MPDTSATDYYQIDWDVLVYDNTFFHSDKFRVITIFVLLFGMGGFLLMLNNALGFQSYEFFSVMFGFNVVIVGIIGIFWNRIAHSFQTSSVHSYKFSRAGLVADDKNYPLFKFDKDDVSKFLEKWDQRLKKGTNFLVLDVPLKKGQVTLFFPDKEIVKKFIKALNHYNDSVVSE